ncbi:MAG: hypothetical protein GY945_02810 [Rhodobacteraceae bacterium]|nr:hypothetical protein [Paracoccaceae bacterium]
MLIAQISDLHLPATGELTFGHARAESGAASRFNKCSPGYLMHQLTRAGTPVTHVAQVPQNETSFPFAPLS